MRTLSSLSLKSLSRFSYYATGLTDLDKVRKALFMFTDLFGMERYNYQHLVTFILTVKTNYRSVVYHNWAHGFHVANSIYSILKVSQEVLDLWNLVGDFCIPLSQ